MSASRVNHTPHYLHCPSDLIIGKSLDEHCFSASSEKREREPLAVECYLSRLTRWRQLSCWRESRSLWFLLLFLSPFKQTATTVGGGIRCLMISHDVAAASRAADHAVDFLCIAITLSWSTYWKICGASSRIPIVPAAVTAKKMYSCRRSITIATYFQSSLIWKPNILFREIFL